MLRRLQRLAFARAMAGGGGRNWVAVAAGVWLLRKAREVWRPEAEVVYRGVIEPGQTVLVDHTTIDRRGKQARRRRR